MNPQGQFRHWVRNAGTPQLAASVLAVALVVAFVAMSVVMAPDDGEVMAAGAGPGAVPGAAGDATSDPSVTVPGGSPTAPGAGAPDASGANGQPGRAPAPSGIDPAVPLEASDRGVTESTVSIGFLFPNDALADAGFSLGDRGDAAAYAQALVDYANRHGGVAGRKVIGAVRPTDPTSTSDQDAACQSMLNDHRVFGVVDLALSNGPAQACIAQQGETPYVHTIAWSRDFQALARGYDVSYAAAIDRIALTVVRDLQQSGWLDDDSVVGVVGDNCPTTKPTVDDVLVPALQRIVARVEVGLHDCTIDAVVRQPPSIATRFRTAGVDHVISVANYISTQIFVETASGLGGWHPSYALSDWFSTVSDGQTRNYDADQFDGAVGITSTRRPLLNAGRPGHAGIDQCNAVAREAGMAPVDGGDAEIDVVLCDQFFLMLDGIDAAGPNPTRPGWAAAMQRLGARDAAIWGPSSFGPGKTSGADQVYTAVWHRDCTCWRAESDPRPMAA